MANKINIVITAEDQASKPIRDVAKEIDGGAEKSSKFKTALSALGGVLRTAALAGGAAALSFGTAGTAIGLNFNSSVEQASAKLNAFMKDQEAVARTLSWVKQEAADTQFSFTEMANAAADLTPVARTSGKSLESLVRQAEVLAALNPAEGLTGAVFSLREALSGDWVSIVDRFNLPRQRINELKAEGVPAMEIISRTLKEMGIDYDLVSKQGQTAAARWDQIKDKFTMVFGRATEPLFKRISEGLNSLNGIDFDRLGDNLAAGMQTALDAVQNVSGALKLLATGQYKPEWFAGLDESHPALKFVRDVRDGLEKLWSMLKPAFDEVGRAFNEQLLPALKDLWSELEPKLIPALKVLVTVVGGALIIGLLAFAKVLTGITIGISEVTALVTYLGASFEKLAGNQILKTISAGSRFGQWLAGLPANARASIDAMGASFNRLPETAGFAAGVTISRFQQMGATVSDFATRTVPSAINSALSWFSQLPTRATNSAAATVTGVGGWFQRLPIETASAVSSMWDRASAVFESFRQSAISWAQGVVSGVVGFFRELPAMIFEALTSATGRVNNWIDGISQRFRSGLSGGLNAHATGTNSAPGGWSLVGEHGPELRRVRAGEEIVPAYRSRGSAPSRGGASVVIENYHTHNQVDEKRFFRDLGFYLELAG